MSGIQSIRNGLTGNVTKVIVVAIIITFIGSVGWAGFFSESNANVVVKVGSKSITTSDLSFEFSSQQNLISERFPDQVVDEEFLVELSTNTLISKFSILDYLDNRGLELPDQYIFQQLSDSDRFIENGNFSRANFDSFARSNGFIPSDYLERIREDLKTNIWRLSLLNSSFITDLEVNSSIALAEQERDISFVKFPIEDFKNSLEYTDDDLKNYYSSNLNSYINPQMVKVTYIQIDRDSLIDTDNISDEAIQIDYDDYLSDFDDTVRKSVSHIMLNIDQDRSLEEALLTLAEVKQKIDSGTAFEDLVTEVSEDEGTKEMGGSLGVTDGTLLPPEFETVLETMSAGEVSEPISLSNSVHLIKLVDQKKLSPSSLEERSQLIVEKLAAEKAEEDYFSFLDQVSELSFSTSDLQEIADLIPFSMVETEFFSENDIPDVLNKANIKDFVFNSSEEDNYPELFEHEGLISTLVQVKAINPETQLSFDQSRENIKKDYINEMSSNNSSLFISEIIRELNDGKTLELIAADNNQEIENYKNLKRDSSLFPLSAIDDIFSLPRSDIGRAYSKAELSNGDSIVYRLDSVKSGQSELSPEQLKSLTEFLNQQKSVSEITEIQLSLQNSINIERYN
tara:strand:+ start:56 stop:1930 length:1875 start_codon:yes stop_codon:yes gene_type:complete